MRTDSSRHSRRSRLIALAVVALALAAVAAGCGQTYKAVAWKDGSGFWLRWTPSDGDIRNAHVNVYCPGSVTRCNEANNAFSEWTIETINSNVRYLNSSYTDYSSHLAWSDIDYEIQNFGDSGWAGLASIGSCVKTGSTAGCRYAFGQTNIYPGYTVSGSAYERKATACQEIGHLFGLGHANGDCMGRSYEDWWRAAGQTAVTSDSLEKHTADGVASLRYLAAACSC